MTIETSPPSIVAFSIIRSHPVILLDRSRGSRKPLFEDTYGLFWNSLIFLSFTILRYSIIMVRIFCIFSKLTLIRHNWVFSALKFLFWAEHRGARAHCCRLRRLGEKLRNNWMACAVAGLRGKFAYHQEHEYRHKCVVKNCHTEPYV